MSRELQLCYFEMCLIAGKLSHQNHLSGQSHHLHHVGLLPAQRCWGQGLSMVTSSSAWLCRFIKEQYGFIVVVSHITRVTCKFQVGLFVGCICNMLENLCVSFWPPSDIF